MLCSSARATRALVPLAGVCLWVLIPTARLAAAKAIDEDPGSPSLSDSLPEPEAPGLEPAADQPQPELESPDITIGEEQDARNHKLQLGLSLVSGSGYLMTIPYGSGDCGAGPSKPCSGRRPTFIDIGLSVGINRSIDVILETRLALESGPDGSNQFWLAPGIKVYFDPDARFKIFTTAQLRFEHVSHAAAARFDFGIRNASGVQLDFHRNVGCFFQFAESLAFVRSLSFEIEGAAGLQARLP